MNGPIRFFTCGKPVGYIIGIILLIILAGSCASQQLGKIRSDFFSLFSFPFCGILFRGITNKPNQTKPNRKKKTIARKFTHVAIFIFFITIHTDGEQDHFDCIVRSVIKRKIWKNYLWYCDKYRILGCTIFVPFG